MLTFDIDVAASDVQTTPPYIVNLGDLIPGSIVSSQEKIWVSLETNATSGGSVFVYGQNNGLYSVSVGYTIPSVSGDLNVLANGFGAQGIGATQNAGGPLTVDNVYNIAAENVGVVDALVRQIFVSQNPVIAGRGSFQIKAKADNDTPAAGDYAEVFTVIAAANY